MDSLISRQSAIDHLKKRLYETALNNVSDADLYQEIADNRIDIWVNEMPSAQPEPTLEQIEEYCHKRCLSIVDNALLHKYAQAEIIRCKDCKYQDENWRMVSVRWLPCMDVRTGSNWYCGSAERGEQDE
jgi:hypothetical protein